MCVYAHIPLSRAVERGAPESRVCVVCESVELWRLYCPSVVLARTCGAYAVSADGTRQAGADQVCQPGTAGVGGG